MLADLARRRVTMWKPERAVSEMLRRRSTASSRAHYRVSPVKFGFRPRTYVVARMESEVIPPKFSVMADGPKAEDPPCWIVTRRSHRGPTDNLVAYIGPPCGETFDRF